MASPIQEINEAVLAAYEAEGYVKQNPSGDPVKDHRAMHRAFLSLVGSHQVTEKNDRASGAISLGEMVSGLFPSLVGPDGFEDEDDPILAYDVHKKVTQTVWSAGNPSKGGAVQKLVGSEHPGLTLVRTTLLAREVPMRAFYLTDDLGCLRQDYWRPGREQIEKLLNERADDMAMLVDRHPDLAEKLAGDFTKQSRKALSHSVDIVQLALDEATGNGADDEDDGDEALVAA